ncbi:MAG: reverse transcriptase domain-containing protein, partial [Cyanobacteria bacterium J06614_10]
LRNFGESFVVALNISKAFDRVWHKALLAKLPAYGFNSSLINLISSFLSDRSISVVVDGTTSSTYSISSGVPQGSVLSPLLFLLFINDLFGSSAVSCHSYADDTTCHSSSKFKNPPSSEVRSASRIAMSHSINVGLEGVSAWGRQNLVNFNASKTCFIPISLSTFSSDYSIIFENTEIEPLSSINILGLNVNSKLSWRSHIEGLAKSASRKLGVLFRCRSFFSSSELLHLYVG